MSENTDDLPPETAPVNLPVAAQGFDSAEKAKQVAYAVGSTVRAISRAINLERLDGFTVAFDYTEALAAIDRGFPNAKPPVATGSKEIVGVAMSVNVLRDGVVKSHLVFYAGTMLPLLSADAPMFMQALSLIAHECGHVADLKSRDEAFPNTILQSKYNGYYENVIFPLGDILWEEYAACRASATFASSETARFEEALVDVLAVATDRAKAAIREYRLHGDINRVVAEAGNPMCEPLRMASYLLGHLDGLDQSLDQVPSAQDAVSRSPYATLVHRQTGALQSLWDRRRQWVSLEEFKPLHQLCIDALAAGGIYLYLQPDGKCRVDIPFTTDTMP